MGRDGESKILFPTMKPLDMPKKADKAEAAPAEVKKEEVIDFSKVEIEPLFADQVDFDTFSKSDFRAVKIKACEAELADRGRVLIRPSGTEPLLRIMVEARDKAMAQTLAERMAQALD